MIQDTQQMGNVRNAIDSMNIILTEKFNEAIEQARSEGFSKGHRAGYDYAKSLEHTISIEDIELWG